MKQMIVNCSTCDMRSVSEETLKSYDQITVNAASVFVTPETKELLNRYNVMLNASAVMELPAGQNVRISTHNGAYTLTADGAPSAEERGVLIVNGALTIGSDALNAALAYEKILVNGAVMLPKSMAGKLTNLHVNGGTETYPDGAIQLRRNAVIDKTFPLRARENALYWAARRLVFTDTALDVEKLAQKGVRFSAKNAVLAESLAEAVAPLLTEDTDLLIVPDGTGFVTYDVKLNRRFLKKYGTKMYVNGDMTVEPDAADVLSEIEYLYVNGDVKVPAELMDAFAEVNAEYQDLVVQKAAGKVIEDNVRATVDKALLEKYPDGVVVSDCVMLRIAKDVPPELLLERLTVDSCAQVFCSPEQEAAVGAVSRNVATINCTDDTETAFADFMKGVFNPDVKLVNAAEYVM